MKKIRRVLKKLVKLIARQVEQQETVIGELKRHNELMAKSLALNTAALRQDARAERSAAVVPAADAPEDAAEKPKPKPRRIAPPKK